VSFFFKFPGIFLEKSDGRRMPVFLSI